MDASADVWHCCTQCSYQSEWKFQVDRHSARNHTHTHQWSDLFCAKAELEEYQYNDSRTFYKLALHDHEQVLSNTEWHKCKHCVFRTCSALVLARHVSTCRAGNKLVLPKTELVMVTVPSYEFSSANREQVKRYNCDHCSFRTKYRVSLRKHNLLHLPSEAIERFNCPLCSHVTIQKRYLKDHIKAMHLPKQADEAITWFECKQCPYKTKQKRYLTGHMLQHTPDESIKWYECTHCSYKAKFKKNLTRHSLQHAGGDAVRWFRCTQCSFKTKMNATLKRHALKHVPDDQGDWFECRQCSYKTRTKKNFNRHLQNHSADQVGWLRCEQCPFQTKSEAYFRRHSRVSHGGGYSGGGGSSVYGCTECSYQTTKNQCLINHMLKHENEGR